MNKRIDIPAHIELCLNHVDSLPLTDPGIVPGIPGSFYILEEKDRVDLTKLVEKIDLISEKELMTWTEDEKAYYSRILQRADRLLKQSLPTDATGSVLERVAKEIEKQEMDLSL